MAYTKTNWINGETPLNADNLNNMEKGIEEAVRLLGVNLISSPADDTTANWAALGNGIVYFNQAGCLNNQPKTYGFVENKVYGSLVFQTFHAMGGSSGVWTRSGNASGWYANSANWVKSLDENSGIQMELIWTNASPTSSFAAQTVSLDLSKYDMVLIITRSSTGNAISKTHICKKGCTERLVMFEEIETSGKNVYIRGRQVTISETGVVIGSGTNRNITGTSLSSGGDGFVIPLTIYGIKGVQ